MIYGKPIGKFKLSVCEPSPAWLRLSYAGGEEISIDPDELSDLEHVCRVAREELERMRASGRWGATLYRERRPDLDMAWWHKCAHCGDQDHECYEVTCARCGKRGWSNDFMIEEDDEWECPPCWQRCEAMERAAEEPSDQVGDRP